jgi:hypothetical protein
MMLVVVIGQQTGRQSEHGSRQKSGGQKLVRDPGHDI